MTTKVFTDRSRTETFQRCNRLRFLEYHQGGTGIVPVKKSLALCVGGSVHVGLATLLLGASKIPTLDDAMAMTCLEQDAVNSALTDFAQFQSALDIDTAEQYAMAGSGGEVADPELVKLQAEHLAKSRNAFDSYLYREQSALVEGMLRAYARRRLRALFEQYEVLEVEREGEWELHKWDSYDRVGTPSGQPTIGDSLWFMSRPDALLRDRESNQLFILSFKTAAKWDRRKAEDAKRDMQGLSEGIEVERRLGAAWEALQRETVKDSGKNTLAVLKAYNLEPPTGNFLMGLFAPPRILGIRYEYLLKGERWTDKTLTAKLEVEVRSQRSPLVGGFLNEGMAAGDERWNASWEFIKDTGEPSKLHYKSWHWSPIFERMPIKQWIDWLDQAVEVVEEGTPRGWQTPAQVTGYLSQHPLDELFIPPIIIYRNEDDLRDLVESVESQEVRVAENVARINNAADEGEKRHLLNILMPMSRRACSYPTDCAMIPVCYGGEEIKSNPLGSGRYKPRVPNHPQESGK